MTDDTRVTVRIATAAQMLDMPRGQVYALINAGALPVVKLPSARNPTGETRTLRVRVADLVKLVNHNTEMR